MTSLETDLVAALGEAGLRVLVATYGGQRLRIHSQPRPDSALARCLGPAVYAALQAAFRGEELDIPTLRYRQHQARASQVRALAASGKTANSFATATLANGRHLGNTIMLSLLLTACTTPTVRDTSAIDDATRQCDTADCVIKLMDTLPQNLQDDRYPFMEGLPDTHLATLQSQGGLTVQPMNPLLLLLGVYGWAYIEERDLGGVYSCDVHYVPGLNWMSLKHELSHCQGYADHGIPIQVADYTDEQKAVMEKEGVKRWVDTSVNRQQRLAQAVTP